MKGKHKKAEYLRVESWLNNKRKIKAAKKLREAEAEARLVQRMFNAVRW